MSGSSGIGGSSPSKDVSGAGEISGMPQGDSGGLMHTGVSTLSELKSLLVKHMGEEKGTKFYNQFLSSMAMQMLGQLQQADRGAKRAAHDMRSQHS